MPLIGVSQTNPSKIDSLKRLVNTTADEPSKINLYGQICWEYLSTRSELDLAENYADSVWQLSEKLNDESGKAKAFYYYGILARHQGDFSKALSDLGNYLNFFKAQGDSTRVAYGLFQVGSVYTSMGDYEKSLETSYRILNIYETDSSYYDIGYTLNMIGVIYKNMKKYDEAIAVYQKALPIYDQLKAEADKANVLVNLANVYTETGMYEEARYYFEQALVIDRANGIKWGVASDLENIGNLFNHLQKHDSALIYYQQALDIRKQLPQKYEIANCYQQIGHTYYLLKDYPESRKNSAKALDLANDTGSKTLLRDIYFTFTNLYAAENDYPKAYEYRLLYSNMQDSILNEATTRQINELQTRYETAEKDKQIVILAQEKQLQEKEIQRQANIKKAFIAGFILIALLAGAIIFVVNQRLKNQKLLAEKNDQIKEAHFRQEMSELEMKALRAQINPHFMFNCMNSINVMILEGQMEKASLYLTKFSRLIRMILENSETDQVTLENELAMLEAYIQLEELRFHEKINYKISVDEQIEPENTLLPSMILQPFVENAIWHGLIHKKEKTKSRISINVKQEDGQLCCTIEDNGVGREKAKALQKKSIWKTKSMGMKITEERLKLLSKEKLQQLIHITDLKDQDDCALGTKVDINISMV